MQLGLHPYRWHGRWGQVTRAESVLRNSGLRLTVHPGSSGSCYVIHTGAAADCRCTDAMPAPCSGDSIEVKTVRWAAGDGIALQSNVSSILFDPLHGTSTPSGTFKVVAASGRAVHHVVNVMGRVRTCSPNGAAGAVPGYRVC